MKDFKASLLRGNLVDIAVGTFSLVVKPVNALVARHEGTPEPTTRPCPECLSEIPLTARRCAFCTSELVL